jgi:hypothetical protein
LWTFFQPKTISAVATVSSRPRGSGLEVLLAIDLSPTLTPRKLEAPP